MHSRYRAFVLRFEERRICDLERFGASLGSNQVNTDISRRKRG